MTLEQRRDTFEAARAHAGRYESDLTQQIVPMENLVAIDPGNEAKCDVIHDRVQRDTLELSGPWTYHGGKVTFTLGRLRVT